MLHFCRDYIYYATVEVLEPKSHEFLATLRQAETIDDVLHCLRLRLEGLEATSAFVSTKGGPGARKDRSSVRRCLLSLFANCWNFS